MHRVKLFSNAQKQLILKVGELLLASLKKENLPSTIKDRPLFPQTLIWYAKKLYLFGKRQEALELLQVAQSRNYVDGKWGKEAARLSIEIQLMILINSKNPETTSHTNLEKAFQLLYIPRNNSFHFSNEEQALLLLWWYGIAIEAGYPKLDLLPLCEKIAYIKNEKREALRVLVYLLENSNQYLSPKIKEGLEKAIGCIFLSVEDETVTIAIVGEKKEATPSLRERIQTRFQQKTISTTPTEIRRRLLIQIRLKNLHIKNDDFGPFWLKTLESWLLDKNQNKDQLTYLFNYAQEKHYEHGSLISKLKIELGEEPSVKNVHQHQHVTHLKKIMMEPNEDRNFVINKIKAFLSSDVEDKEKWLFINWVADNRKDLISEIQNEILWLLMKFFPSTTQIPEDLETHFVEKCKEYYGDSREIDEATLQTLATVLVTAKFISSLAISLQDGIYRLIQSVTLNLARYESNYNKLSSAKSKKTKIAKKNRSLIKKLIASYGKKFRAGILEFLFIKIESDSFFTYELFKLIENSHILNSDRETLFDIYKTVVTSLYNDKNNNIINAFCEQGSYHTPPVNHDSENIFYNAYLAFSYLLRGTAMELHKLDSHTRKQCYLDATANFNYLTEIYYVVEKFKKSEGARVNVEDMFTISNIAYHILLLYTDDEKLMELALIAMESDCKRDKKYITPLVVPIIYALISVENATFVKKGKNTEEREDYEARARAIIQQIYLLEIEIPGEVLDYDKIICCLMAKKNKEDYCIAIDFAAYGYAETWGKKLSSWELGFKLMEQFKKFYNFNDDAKAIKKYYSSVLFCMSNLFAISGWNDFSMKVVTQFFFYLKTLDSFPPQYVCWLLTEILMNIPKIKDIVKGDFFHLVSDALIKLKNNNQFFTLAESFLEKIHAGIPDDKKIRVSGKFFSVSLEEYINIKTNFALNLIKSFKEEEQKSEVLMFLSKLIGSFEVDPMFKKYEEKILHIKEEFDSYFTKTNCNNALLLIKNII